MGSRLLTAPAVPAAAFAWGLQFAFFNPALALILATRFDATGAQIGLALGVYNASGFASSLVIPMLADRRGNYLAAIIWSGIATLPLMAVLGLSTSLPAAITALFLLGGPASVGSSLLFAHLQAIGLPQRSIINTRAIVSFAWVAGPPMATLIAAAFGDQAIVIAIALIAILGLVTTFLMRRGAPEHHERKPAADSGLSKKPLSSLAVGGVGLAFVALQATNYVVTSIMTLYVSGTLHLPIIWAGAALAVAAALEIPALLLIGKLSSRYSSLALIAAACVVGAGYYTALAFVQGPVALIAAQVLNAAFFAVVAGIGLTFFQEIIPRPGLASGLFTNVRRLGSIVSGGLIALAAVLGGYRNMFLICAALTIFALSIITTIGLLHRRHSEPSVESQTPARTQPH